MPPHTNVSEIKCFIILVRKQESKLKNSGTWMYENAKWNRPEFYKHIAISEVHVLQKYWQNNDALTLENARTLSFSKDDFICGWTNDD